MLQFFSNLPTGEFEFAMQMEPPPMLKCFVVNDGSSVGFPVRDVRGVTGLQTQIKTFAPNTVTCNADKLQLYLARRSDEWLSLEEAKALESDPDGRIVDKQTRLVQIFTLLDQGDELEKALTGLALEKGKIHVLVVVPKKRARAAAPEEKVAAKIPKVSGAYCHALRDRARQVANIGVTLNSETDLAAGERLTTLPASTLGVNLAAGLFVRQEYWEVYNIIQRLVKTTKPVSRILAQPVSGILVQPVSRILVLGSPGIGKSVFGIFLLLVLMTERKDVAYRPLDQYTVWFFTWNGEEYDVSEEPVAGKTYDGLFDGEESRGILDDILFRHAYLFATPRDSNYHYFKKEKCIKVMMNPWTKEECQSFADALELVNHHEWLSRFNLVGGNPRSLFLSCESFDEVFARVERCVTNSMETLKRRIEEEKFGNNSTPILFHCIDVKTGR